MASDTTRTYSSLALFASRMADRRSGVSVESRKFLGTFYVDCFVGSACIDWIVSRQKCTRAQAIEIGNELVQQGFVIHSVDKNRLLIDGKFFYFFTNDVKKRKTHLTTGKIPTTAKELARMMAEPNSGLSIKPRRFFLTVYPPCFKASQAVDWLLNNLALRNRKEAVEFGKKLVNEGFIQHVKEPLPFQDTKNWFRFTKYVHLHESVSVEETIEPALHCRPSDFEQIRRLGEGGYGTVKLVQKKDNGKRYAMKIINKTALELQDSKTIEYINTEKKVLINNSPFLLHLHYSFQTSSKLYLVTDFLPGGDLFHHLSKRTGKPIEKGFHPLVVRFFTAEIVLALEHLHQCGVIYRDLKLENVLLDELGHICLADFGLSKFLPEDDRTNTMCGSQGYLAPEMLKEEAYSYQVDWFSLGVMVYELISTRNPFLGKTFYETGQSILHGSVNFPKEYFSSQLASFLEKALEKDPQKRFQCAAEIKRHPWFKGMDWHKLSLKKVTPPFDFRPLHRLEDEDALPPTDPLTDGNDDLLADEHDLFRDFSSSFPRP